MNNRMAKRVFVVFLVIALLLIPLCEPFTPTAEAASKATTNKKAKALYKKQIEKIKAKNVVYVCYKFADITGDGIVEAMIEYFTGKDGSGRKFVIYSYKKGKLVKLYSENEYGLQRISVYKKGVVMYNAGHGHEEYSYYTKSSSGKLKLVGSKGRMIGDGVEWIYRDKSGKELTKAAFDKLVKKTKTGSKKTYSLSNWTWE